MGLDFGNPDECPRGLGRAGSTYVRRRPENTVLHQVVRAHLETFLAEVRLRNGGDGLPRFVERELREYLSCSRRTWSDWRAVRPSAVSGLGLVAWGAWRSSFASAIAVAWCSTGLAPPDTTERYRASQIRRLPNPQAIRPQAIRPQAKAPSLRQDQGIRQEQAAMRSALCASDERPISDLTELSPPYAGYPRQIEPDIAVSGVSSQRLLAAWIDTLASEVVGTTEIACGGDCSADGAVTVDEIVTATNIALGITPMAVCLAADADQNDVVTADELVVIVNDAMHGCPTAITND